MSLSGLFVVETLNRPRVRRPDKINVRSKYANVEGFRRFLRNDKLETSSGKELSQVANVNTAPNFLNRFYRKLSLSESVMSAVFFCAGRTLSCRVEATFDKFLETASIGLLVKIYVKYFVALRRAGLAEESRAEII